MKALRSSPPAWIHPLCAATLLALGAAIRTVAYLRRPSLWIDEGALALGIAGHSAMELLGRLDYEQSAPIPFVLAERAMVLVAGVNELSLRFLPFLAGLLLPFAVLRVAQRILGPAPALLALALAVGSNGLIRYSNEVKPYGLDAVVACALAWLVLDVLDAPESGRAWRILACGGAAAILVSRPAVFVLAGAAAALAASRAVRRAPGARRRFAWSAGVWGALTAAIVLVSRIDGAYVRRFWEARFLSPDNAELAGISSMLARQYAAFLFRPAPGPVTNAVAVLVWLTVAAGFLVLGLRRGSSIALLAGVPLAAAIAASALRLYPASPRLLLFAAPFLFVAAGAAVAQLLAPIRSPAVAAVLVALLCGTEALLSLRGSRPLRARGADDTAAVIARIREARRPLEAVYLFPSAIPVWVYYTTDWTAPDRSRLVWYAQQARSPGGVFSEAPTAATSDDAFVYPTPSGREVLGHALDFRARTTAPEDLLPPGWTENEARRIRAEASEGRGVWLFDATRHQGPERFERLLAALASAGGRRTSEDLGRTARSERYVFDGAPVR